MLLPQGTNRLQLLQEDWLCGKEQKYGGEEHIRFSCLQI